MKNATRNCVYLVVLVLCCALAGAAQTETISLTPVDKTEAEKWRNDLRYMAEEMPKFHKNLFHTMTREHFASAVNRLNERIPKLARHQIIVEMARIVAMVGDGHTNIAPTRDPKIGFHILPVKLYFFADGLYVRSATTEQSDLLGAKVLNIGNATTAEAYQKVGELIGRDNEMDIKFFAAFLLTMPEVLHATGLIDDPNEARFVVESAGQTRTVTLKPAGPAAMMPPDTDLSWLPQPGWIDVRDTTRVPTPLWLKDPTNKYWFEYLPSARTLYLQVNQIGNKDDESMQVFTNRLLTFIDSSPVERLALDLRLNRGGNGEFNRPLLRAIIKANKIDQRGKLFVIIGRSSWSAAQFLINNLEDYTNAIFVGEPSGGKRNSYGDSRRITLPNSGMTVRVSTLWWQEDERDRRQWKSPELAAELTFENYRNNVDPALKMALEYVPGKSLTELLAEAAAATDSKMVSERFKQWRANPVNKYVEVGAQLNRLGYELLTKKQVVQAIEVFKLNVAEYPGVSNVYDSLAEAYAVAGNRELAIQNYQRAVELDSKNSAAATALQKLREATSPLKP
jgi:tetratricopeptide (TPR) repeat protein